MDAVQGAKRAAISVVVTRADGTVEDFGIVSYYAEDDDEQARIDAAIADGRVLHEADVFVPDRGRITFSGSAVKE